MMELMLPEARHHRSASEHLLRTANDLTKSEIPSSFPEDDDDGKFEVAVNRPVSEAKPLKSALKKPKEAEPPPLTPLTLRIPENKPSKPRKLTVDEKQTVVNAVGVVKPESAPLSPKEPPSPEEKKQPEEKKLERSASTKQADAAAGLAAKMAARLASKKALLDTPKPALDSTPKPALDSTPKPAVESTPKPAVKITAPATATSSTTENSKPAEAKEDPLVPPENRPMTKSIADGRPRGDTDKPNKPAKPGRARGTTNTTTSPTQTASP